MATPAQIAFLAFVALTAALAGFLFGFDTIVISGAEETFQRLWQLDQRIQIVAHWTEFEGTSGPGTIVTIDGEGILRIDLLERDRDAIADRIEAVSDPKVADASRRQALKTEIYSALIGAIITTTLVLVPWP